jgi:hypothetical protein
VNIQQKRSNSGFAGILVVFLIVAVGAVAFFILSKNSKISLPFLQNTQNTSDWKTYTNSNAGFSLKYPPSVLLENQKGGIDQSTLFISAEKLSDIPEDLPSLMGRNDALASKALLESGKGVSTVKIGNLYGAIGAKLSQFEICSVILSRSLTFYPGEYRVIISLAGPEAAIMDSMPEFFTVDEKNCGKNRMWDQNNKNSFLDVLAKKQGKGAAQEWYDTFDAIVKTVTLITPASPSPTAAATPASDLLTYKNFQYGFEISYPKTYQPLTAKSDLSGYPNGVLLLYTGGQAYDVVVEVWSTKAAYETAYGPRVKDLTVLESGGKFITALDNTSTSENKEVIKTFKLLQ